MISIENLSFTYEHGRGKALDDFFIIVGDQHVRTLPAERIG